MTQFFSIHPENPQMRLIREAVRLLEAGGVVIYPTDAAYAIGCKLGDAKAVERIRQLRDLTEAHYFTLVCRDLSDIGTYAVVDNPTFRFLKAHTPGPYTFILPATREVPKRLLQPKRQTIGLRIPDSVMIMALLAELHEPLMSVSLVASEDETSRYVDARDIYSAFMGKVDLVIESGEVSLLPTTVISLTASKLEILRIGKGSVDGLE